MVSTTCTYVPCASSAGQVVESIKIQKERKKHNTLLFTICETVKFLLKINLYSSSTSLRNTPVVNDKKRYCKSEKSQNVCDLCAYRHYCESLKLLLGMR